MDTVTTDVIKAYIAQNEIALKCTQKAICTPVINRFYKKMSSGIRFSNINVFDGLICDGHHRYIASLIAGVEIGINPSWKTAATEVIDWKAIDFHEEDYYSKDDINRWNQEDADFNSMTVAEVREILK